MIGKWIKIDNWYRERKKDPNYFDERSFRTKKSDDHMITFGCKKGFWNDKNQLCKIGVEIQTIMHPLKESMHENPQVCLLGMKKNLPDKKWYFGDMIGKYSMVKIFSSVVTPTKENYGGLYKFVTGPFKTRKEAINAAVYRGSIK